MSCFGKLQRLSECLRLAVRLYDLRAAVPATDILSERIEQYAKSSRVSFAASLGLLCALCVILFVYWISNETLLCIEGLKYVIPKKSGFGTSSSWVPGPAPVSTACHTSGGLTADCAILIKDLPAPGRLG